ncbi:MAG: hypothetical protein ACHQJ4_03425 [Ignavibacteria bacterium]
MSKLMAFSAPILPGKTEQWKKFINELKTTRNKEFSESRKSLNIRERSFLQQTPMGDVVVVTLEGDEPAAAFASIANSNNPFSEWFVKEVIEIHGFNLKDMMKMPQPELILDSHTS